MALEGTFVAEVQEYVSQLTKQDGVVILDAATGAGETTVQLAQAMQGGKLITVDSDPSSWHDWALPALEKAQLSGRVEFEKGDLRCLPMETGSVDLMVSDATLSALGIYAVDVINEFHRVLKASGRLAIRDLIPESETEQDPDNVSALSWRLAKAAAHLAGRSHYEELPTDWIRARLEQSGFEVVSFQIHPSRRPASEASFEEWCKMEIAADIPDEDLRTAIRKSQQRYVNFAQKNGLTTKTGYYTCWAVA